MSRSKYWCFTVNNYTTEDEQSLKSLFLHGKCTYLVFQREEGESGTPHLQGYIELHDRLRLACVKRLGGLQRAHLELRRGTAEQARAYCLKEESRTSTPLVVELGTISKPAQGKRTDLDRALDDIREGATIGQLWADHPKVMVRYRGAMQEAISRLGPQKKRKTFPLETFTNVPEFEEGYSHILCGPAGCGKSALVKAKYPTALWVTHMDDLVQFDGDRHEAIIFDDMSFTHMPRGAQIHIVDQDDDRSIHVRYTVAHIPANTIKVFTTNVRQIFDLDDPAIKRRVKVHIVDNLIKN